MLYLSLGIAIFFTAAYFDYTVRKNLKLKGRSIPIVVEILDIFAVLGVSLTWCLFLYLLKNTPNA